MKQSERNGYALFIASSIMLLGISAAILLVCGLHDGLNSTFKWIYYCAIAMLVIVLTGWLFTSYFIARSLRRRLAWNQSRIPHQMAEKDSMDHVVSVPEPTSPEDLLPKEPITPDQMVGEDLEEGRVVSLQIPPTVPDQMVVEEEDKDVSSQEPTIPDKMVEKDLEDDRDVPLQISPTMPDQTVKEDLEDNVVFYQEPTIPYQMVKEDLEEGRVVAFEISPTMPDQTVEDDLEEGGLVDFQEPNTPDQIVPLEESTTTYEMAKELDDLDRSNGQRDSREQTFTGSTQGKLGGDVSTEIACS